VETDAHPGVLPSRGSIVEVAPPAFEISAIKLAEDGRGLLIRGWNSTGQPLKVILRPGKKFSRAERVSLAEERLSSLRLGKNGDVSFPAKPHEIVSILFGGGKK
jgi:alpha-mannosidase